MIPPTGVREEAQCINFICNICRKYNETKNITFKEQLNYLSNRFSK